MSLGDMLDRDLGKVFFNMSDFGERHCVEGRDIVCILDRDTMQARRGASLGVSDRYLFLEAKEADLPSRRREGDSLNIDGAEYLIADWSVELGMATLTLYQHRSRGR